MSPFHPTAPLLDPFTGDAVAIDVGLVPVIEAIWTLGIETVGCCEGWPGAAPSLRAVIVFAYVGRTDPFGLPRGRYRGTKQGAVRLAGHLHRAAPGGRWRSWSWQLDRLNRASSLVLPHRELPVLEAHLERAVLLAGGQTTLGGTP